MAVRVDYYFGTQVEEEGFSHRTPFSVAPEIGQIDVRGIACLRQLTEKKGDLALVNAECLNHLFERNTAFSDDLPPPHHLG